jgi:hypothetical protein
LSRRERVSATAREVTTSSSSSTRVRIASVAAELHD